MLTMIFPISYTNATEIEIFIDLHSMILLTLENIQELKPTNMVGLHYIISLQAVFVVDVEL